MTETQPTREDKIAKIYEMIQAKNVEKSYSCKRVWEAWNIGTMTQDDFEEVDTPVMIGDVLYYRNGMTTTMELVQRQWRRLREPIDNQSDECVNYVFSLLPTTPGN